MKCSNVLVFVALAVNFLSFVGSARILGIFPYPSKSHSILGQALFTELAGRGHEVTYVSPFPLKDPPKNYKDIHLTSKCLMDSFEHEMNQTFAVVDVSPLTMVREWFDNVALMVECFLFDPATQELIHSKNEKFDLVIIEFLMNEAVIGFGKHFNAPIIGLSTVGQFRYVNDMIHNSAPSSVIPHPFLALSDRMGYMDRLSNVLFCTFEDVMTWIYHYPLQAAIYNKAFPDPKKPTFYEVLNHGVSLVLLNTHFTINFPQAYLPTLVEVGGFHVKTKINPLPTDILAFIESAKYGVVYFSMGGNLKTSIMDEQKKEGIVAAFSKLKQKVIMKWDTDDLPVKFDNIMVRKWLPQDDILAHDNVKLFVTHGGLLSSTESIFRGVPVVGIPIFGDQMLNMKRAEILGFGLQVIYTNLTESSLSWAVNAVLNDKKFAKNVKEVAMRLQDQPLSPMENAMFWVEYVIRHKGAYHLQSSAKYLNYIQYHNADIYVSLATVLFLIIFLPFYVIKKILRLLIKKAKSDKIDKSKKRQ